MRLWYGLRLAVFTRISIHALHTECDVIIVSGFMLIRVFQSTHSIQSATCKQYHSATTPKNFNPRTPYRVRLTFEYLPPGREPISIHALHTECDGIGILIGIYLVLFQSTHSIQSATTTVTPIHYLPIFQSTHSIQSATRLRCSFTQSSGNFNPRTPYRVRPINSAGLTDRQTISIHALHTECDSEK